MDRAKAQGHDPPERDLRRLRVLWGGAARMLTADEVDDPAEWRRYAALVLDALRVPVTGGSARARAPAPRRASAASACR